MHASFLAKLLNIPKVLIPKKPHPICYWHDDGIIREIKLLSDAEVTVLSERRTNAPYGLFGGESGKCGKNIIIQDGQKKEMPGKFFVKLRKGDILRIETPGGGGYGQIKRCQNKI